MANYFIKTTNIFYSLSNLFTSFFANDPISDHQVYQLLNVVKQI
jgi:hypothetical protein